jgi:3-dehydroquinate dehydratase-2
MKILIINGPNLNMLGKRDPTHYGAKSLKEIEGLVGEKARDLGVEVEFFQSNHEGDLVGYIQTEAPQASGIVINAGALTHYSLALRDALVDSRLPVMEVHLSNIHAREEFRHYSTIAPIAIGQIAGLGWQGYNFALEYLATHIER